MIIICYNNKDNKNNKKDQSRIKANKESPESIKIYQNNL